MKVGRHLIFLGEIRKPVRFWRYSSEGFDQPCVALDITLVLYFRLKKHNEN